MTRAASPSSAVRPDLRPGLHGHATPTIDGRLGLKVVDPRIYIGIGYLSRSENYGYPRQGGFGFGTEKLPDLDQPFSVYGSVWYYPNVSANSRSGSDVSSATAT